MPVAMPVAIFTSLTRDLKWGSFQKCTHRRWGSCSHCWFKGPAVLDLVSFGIRPNGLAIWWGVAMPALFLPICKVYMQCRMYTVLLTVAITTVCGMLDLASCRACQLSYVCDLPVGSWNVGIDAASSGSQDISGGCLAVTCMLVMSLSTFLHCIPADGDYHDSRLLHSARQASQKHEPRQSKRMVELSMMPNDKFEHCLYCF